MHIEDHLKYTTFDKKVVSLILLGIIFISITVGYTNFLNSFVIATNEYQKIEANAINSIGEKTNTFSKGEPIIIKTKLTLRGSGESIYYSEFLISTNKRDVNILIEIVDDQGNLIHSETNIVDKNGYCITYIPISEKFLPDNYQVKISSSNQEESSFNIFVV